MIDYKSELIVNKPVAEVFEYMKNAANYDKWTDMSGTHLVSGHGIGLGSQIETTMKIGPSKRTMVFEVVAFEPNRRIGWKTATKGPLNWDAEYLFEAVDTGATRVVSSGMISLNGALKFMEGMMAGEVRNGEANELVKFKQLVEAMM